MNIIFYFFLSSDIKISIKNKLVNPKVNLRKKLIKKSTHKRVGYELNAIFKSFFHISINFKYSTLLKSFISLFYEIS